MNTVRGLITLIFCSALLIGAARLVTAPLDARGLQAQAEIKVLSAEITALESRVAMVEATKVLQTVPDTLSDVAEDALTAELALQTTILNLATERGLAPNGFGPTTLDLKSSLNTVAFELEFEAGYATALAFIAAVENHSSRIVIETLWVRQIPVSSMPEEETPVSVRLSVWRFWRAPEVGAGGGAEN